MGEAPLRGTLQPGSEIDGFVIEGVAGRGGMGVVYRARQKRPDRVVALKVIAADLADDPAFRARFQRESTIAAQIEHPNVIPVYAVGEAAGVLYLVMRYVEGTDLRSVLEKEGRLEPGRAAAIIDAVGQALDAAHAHGLVHRDVKPANILLSTAGRRDHVYLSDFGLSRHVESSDGVTRSGVFLGTIDYVAPEQARGDRVDARADVYSLGCVLFFALTGTVPFPLDNDLAKLDAHARREPPSLLQRAGDLPAQFETVLARAMAKSPDHRYQSAGDLGRAAVAAASGAPLPSDERTVAEGRAAPVRGPAAPVAPGPTSAPTTTPVDSSSSPEGVFSGVTEAEPTAALERPMTSAAGEEDVEPTPTMTQRRRRRGASHRRLIAGAAIVSLAAGTAIALSGGRDGEPGAGGARVADGTRGSAVITEANLTANASFETGTAGWEANNSAIARVAGTDAPDGRHVARVTMMSAAEDYAIDDAPATVDSSVADRSYTAVAWVKATEASDGKPVCVAIRERNHDGENAGYVATHVTASADQYRPIRVKYVAAADGHKIDVHVFRRHPSADTNEPEAFLVDAITITEGDSGAASPACPA